MKETETKETETQAELLKPPRAIRILLVDDDEDEYIITQRLFLDIEGGRHILDWASTYEQALVEIDKQAHDIYLIDYRLGVQTGLDLLRAAIERGCTSPMILLTGQEDRAVDIEAMNAGAWDYLVKGHIDAMSLERSIRYTLEHQRVLNVLRNSEYQRDRFVATLTHDLKTPVKAEFRILELLMSGRFGPITDEQRVVIDEMLKSNRFMYQMVDNLLQSFKYEKGRVTLRFEPTNLNALVTSIVMPELHALMQDKSQSLELSLAPDLPLIQLDAFEFKRVVYNLVQNAINYTPTYGRIHVKTFQEGDMVCLAVEDNGPGIDPLILDQIFKPYAAVSKRYRHIGTGLGLYISKKIVLSHNGLMLLENCSGQGCSFICKLPITQSEAKRVLSFND